MLTQLFVALIRKTKEEIVAIAYFLQKLSACNSIKNRIFVLVQLYRLQVKKLLVTFKSN